MHARNILVLIRMHMNDDSENCTSEILLSFLQNTLFIKIHLNYSLVYG